MIFIETDEFTQNQIIVLTMQPALLILLVWLCLN